VRGWVKEIVPWGISGLGAPLLGGAAKGAHVPRREKKIAVELSRRDRLVELAGQSMKGFRDVLRKRVSDLRDGFSAPA
jgi:hypothetical protein